MQSFLLGVRPDLHPSFPPLPFLSFILTLPLLGKRNTSLSSFIFFFSNFFPFLFLAKASVLLLFCPPRHLPHCTFLRDAAVFSFLFRRNVISGFLHDSFFCAPVAASTRTFYLPPLFHKRKKQEETAGGCVKLCYVQAQKNPTY